MIDDADIPRVVPPELIIWHADIVCDALDGAARQFDRARMFVRNGDIAAAITTYDRARSICLEFATPGLRALLDADRLFGEAAAEWRAERDRSVARRPAVVRKERENAA